MKRYPYLQGSKCEPYPSTLMNCVCYEIKEKTPCTNDANVQFQCVHQFLVGCGQFRGVTVKDCLGCDTVQLVRSLPIFGVTCDFHLKGHKAKVVATYSSETSMHYERMIFM